MMCRRLNSREKKPVQRVWAAATANRFDDEEAAQQQKEKTGSTGRSLGSVRLGGGATAEEKNRFNGSWLQQQQSVR